MTTYAVVDFETTGLSPSHGARPIEIAVVLVKESRIIDRYQTLINPGARIPDDIQKLTGITDCMVKNAPSIRSAMKEVWSYVGARTIVAHNAAFDRKFWDFGLSLIQRKRVDDFLCTLLLARRLFPDLANYRLDTIVEVLNLPSSGTYHRALADAECTAHLLIRLQAEALARFDLSKVDKRVLLELQRSSTAQLTKSSQRLRANQPEVSTIDSSSIGSNSHQLAEDTDELEVIIAELFDEYEQLETQVVNLKRENTHLERAVATLHCHVERLMEEKSDLKSEIEAYRRQVEEISTEFRLLREYSTPVFEKQWREIKARVQKEVMQESERIKDRNSRKRAEDVKQKSPENFFKEKNLIIQQEARAEKIKRIRANKQRRKRRRVQKTQAQSSENLSTAAPNSMRRSNEINSSHGSSVYREHDIDRVSAPGKISFVCDFCSTKNVVDDEYLLTCSFCKRTRFSS